MEEKRKGRKRWVLVNNSHFINEILQAGDWKIAGCNPFVVAVQLAVRWFMLYAPEEIHLLHNGDITKQNSITGRTDSICVNSLGMVMSGVISGI